MYKIGDVLEVATKMWHEGLVLETEYMKVSKIIMKNDKPYYCFDNNDYRQYPESRILRKVNNFY